MSDTVQLIQTPGLWESIKAIWPWFWETFKFLMKMLWPFLLLLLVVVIARYKLESWAEKRHQLAVSKKCIGCAEWIKKDAVICPHCQTKA